MNVTDEYQPLRELASAAKREMCKGLKVTHIGDTSKRERARAHTQLPTHARKHCRQTQQTHVQ